MSLKRIFSNSPFSIREMTFRPIKVAFYPSTTAFFPGPTPGTVHIAPGGLAVTAVCEQPRCEVGTPGCGCGGLTVRG
jgi:hypothetical protein